jgi:hypothetical protein
MHFTHLRAAALLALAAAALGACDRLPSDPGVPHEAAPSASTRVSAPEPDALAQDAEVYAARYRVSVDEALRRLRLQESVGNLNADLQANYPETFAGLVIEHEPEYRVVARFTRGGAEALQRAVREPGLAAVVHEEHGEVPLQRLQARLEAAYARVRGRGIEATAGLNLRLNRPEIYVPRAAAALARAAIPVETGAAVVEVERLPTPEVLLYGGLNLSSCTSGFYVRNSAGTQGISTAGHCPSSQSYAGFGLTYVAEAYSGSYDVQWHTLAGATYSNQIQVGATTRPITITRPRAAQSSGEWVCKQGMTTGNTCGTLSTNSYCYAGACTFVYVSGGSVNLSEGGDSGGPWFSGNSAYGSHVFGNGNDSGYMAQDYFWPGLGVAIVVHTGVAVDISGPYSIARYQSAQFIATPRDGTAPYTYEWRTRDGLNNSSWGAWSGWFSTGSTNSTYASVNSCGINQKQLEVRVTDGTAAQANGTYTVYVSNPC